jgi:hypothetical protein
MNTKLKWRTAGRLRRGAVLAGVVGLAAGAAMLTAGSALAAQGSQPGNLVLNPATGALTSTPTWSTTTGCPAGFQGSGEMVEFKPDGVTLASRISPAVGTVTSAFSGTLDGNVGALLNVAGVSAAAPGTSEWAIGCYSGSGGTGSVQYVQSTFVSVAAGATAYTSSATGPVTVATSTVLTASPSPAPVGGTVTLTATETGTDSTHPAGTVTFQAGGSNINATPIAVSAAGVATTTTSFAATGTEALTAIFTPTVTGYSGSTGSTSLVVQAAGTQTAGSEPISVNVPQSGSLTVTVAPGTVTLTPVTPATTPDETATGTLQNVTVTDTRNYYPGWSVSGQESNFTGSGTAAGQTLSGNQLGWTPTPVGSLVGGALIGSAVAPLPGGAGIGSVAAVLAQAHAGTGFGTNVLSANLLLDIPPTTVAGPYTGSLTITYVVSNP